MSRHERLAKWVEKVLPSACASTRCSVHCRTPAMRGATTRHQHGHSARGAAVPDVVCCGWYRVLYTVPVVASRVYLRARMCFCCSFQQFWMHVPYVWHPTNPGLACCNTDAHACVCCVRVCPRFFRPLTVVDEIREAIGRYVLTPRHSLSLAHPRCVCTATRTPWLDGEDSTSQSHAYGRIPSIKDRTQRSTACTSRPSFSHASNKQEVAQRLPHLLEQRMFIVKLSTATSPYGCRVVCGVRVRCVVALYKLSPRPSQRRHHTRRRPTVAAPAHPLGLAFGVANDAKRSNIVLKLKSLGPP